MIHVKTEISRGMMATLARQGRSVASVETGLGAALAGALGSAIRHRVERLGNLAGQFAPDWDDVYKPKLVSSRYPDNTPAQWEHWSGAKRYKTSREYHSRAGSKRGRYSVTGGMWAGLARVVWSDRRVELRFRGRSDGQDARVLNRKSRPVKVNNAFKAWTVLDKHRVNVLLMTEVELAAALVGLQHSVAARVAQRLAVSWSSGAPTTSDVGEIFRSAFRVQTETPTAVAIG